MPIKPENKARYPKDWPAISAKIRARAGDKCETCKVPNGAVVLRDTAGTLYMLEDGKAFSVEDGQFLGMIRGSEMPAGHFVKIVLTVAHLDHVPENCADDNLKALCQRCHLRYDAAHHRKTANATRRARKAAGDLFS